MEDNNSSNDAVSFSDFPEDVQLSILSFLAPPEISTFACTSKRFVSLCSDDAKLWLSMCLRRWGAHTDIRKWGSPYRRLYQILSTWENLIGFWRQGGPQANSPPLIFFEWGPSCIAGSRVCPAEDGESYGVVKSPFLWMSVTAEGEPECRAEMGADLVAVSVSVMGKNHFVVEEEMATSRKAGASAAVSIERGGEEIGYESGSPGSSPGSPLEIYQYFANRTSPGGERATRRQRRREREKQIRRKLESLHFVKIVDCEPTPARPLQGLWKVPS